MKPEQKHFLPSKFRTNIVLVFDLRDTNVCQFDARADDPS